MANEEQRNGDDGRQEQATDASRINPAIALGISIGVSIGASIGILLDNIALGLAMGLGIGVAMSAGLASTSNRNTDDDAPQHDGS